MKNFKIEVTGLEVTQDNFKDVVKTIVGKYGLCPAIHDIVMQLVSSDESADLSRDGVSKSIEKAVRLVGYSPRYYFKVMRRLCSE